MDTRYPIPGERTTSDTRSRHICDYVADIMFHVGRAFLPDQSGRNTRYGEDKKLAREAIAAMQDYRWPGNVRELMTTVKRATMLSRGKLIKTEDLRLGEGAGRATRYVLAPNRAIIVPIVPPEGLV